VVFELAPEGWFGSSHGPHRVKRREGMYSRIRKQQQRLRGGGGSIEDTTAAFSLLCLLQSQLKYL
jgi:hypothetical protein